MTNWHFIALGYMAAWATIVVLWAAPRVAQWAWWRWWVKPRVPRREPLTGVPEGARVPGVRCEFISASAGPSVEKQPNELELYDGPVGIETGKDYYAVEDD